MIERSGLRVAHHHPGRLRVRADAFLDDGPAAEKRGSGSLASAASARSRTIHEPGASSSSTIRVMSTSMSSSRALPS